jgi:hypothetical protein
MRGFLVNSKEELYGTNSMEKPPVVQMLKNFPTFYGTRRFITVFTRALHLSIS